ncbi:MAG: PfkB family carbohydrate kinase [bacterium]|nr:PfkB family carbohydrate kinase [bacterium]MDT8395692.1 PfkB family carbohydrate kinase [bacterium]
MRKVFFLLPPSTSCIDMILVVGNLNYDILLPMDRFPSSHEKMTCESAVAGCGGSAANTAWWLAKLGVPVALAGAVGSDPMGQAQLADLEAAGVRIRGVIRTPGSTGLAVIFSLGREKRMVRAPGANLHTTFFPGLLDGCRILYLSGADIPVLAQYARGARQRGITVLCGRHGAQDEAVASHADGFILNSDEVRELTGVADPEDGVRALDARLAVVTLPEGGCLVSEGIEVVHVPSPELDPVDRTGGGDAFAAGFIAGFYSSLSLEECGELGNKLASMVIMERGGRPEISLGCELKFQV